MHWQYDDVYGKYLGHPTPCVVFHEIDPASDQPGNAGMVCENISRPEWGHLIEAAPRMLERLRAILTAYDANDSHSVREEIENARSIVAKNTV